MNKKAVGPISMIFTVLVFVIVWVFLAGWISDAGEEAASNSNLTGVEAFVYMNLNMVIFFSLIIMIAAFTYAMRSGGGGF